MILADKIIYLRKKNGMSQEELAERMGVSRQSVSKWEGAQSLPELDKILLMSELFGVSTDALLKDDLTVGEDPNTKPLEKSESGLPRVTREEAIDYINKRYANAPRIALGVLLCILSPIPLILLATLGDYSRGITETQIVTVGLSSLFILVAAAVALFIACGSVTRDYEHLSTVPFETEHGVLDMIKDMKRALNRSYTVGILVGSLLCLLSPLPLFWAAVSEREPHELYVIGAVCVLLALVAIGVFAMVLVSCRMGALEVLLQQGDYTRENKSESKLYEAFSALYWLGMTGLYLGVSFLTEAWHLTWMIWVAAALIANVAEALWEQHNEKKHT